jgi:IMP dehydrogenase
MKMREGLTFDDLLLVPQYSDIESRSLVDTSVKLSKNGFSTILRQPIVPANMRHITEYAMAKEIYISGGLALVHRFMPIEDQFRILQRLADEFGDRIWRHIGLSVGVKKEDYETVDTFIRRGAEIICIDIAHGDSKQCVDMCAFIHEKHPSAFLIAGTIATGEAAKRLWSAGADMVRVNVGCGSICSTRLMTGNGVPQMTALIDVAEAKKQMMQGRQDYEQQFYIMSDGGVRQIGDLVKALCFADVVMTGNMFAGAKETPGNVIQNLDGKTYKEYAGSSTHKTTHVEGVAAIVATKGRTQDILTKMLEGIRSGMSYQGCRNLTELKENPEFIRITNASLVESNIHDVIVQ